MDLQPDNKQPEDYTLDDARYVWDEYRYRHEHIWGLIFKITAAVVAISIVPYVANERTLVSLKPLIICLPAIGLALLILCWFRLNREFEILKEVKNKHRKFHELKFGIFYDQKQSSFSKHVRFYLLAIGALCIINILLLLIFGIPDISKTGELITPRP
jgi:hypothetical protein